LKDSLVDYLDILFEQATLDIELDCLSDEVLLEECNHILAGFTDCQDVEDILISFFKTGKITKEERKRAEALYRLMYAEFYLNT
jgi:hypothetical protein